MNAPEPRGLLLRQHVIDPEICIRCNTCEATCPVGAVTHDDLNYVVDPDKCNFCMACVPPCPTGSIDNWREVPRARPYTVAEQLGWEALPEPLTDPMGEAGLEAGLSASDRLSAAPDGMATESRAEAPTATAPAASVQAGATVPPWSAAHPYVRLYGLGSAAAQSGRPALHATITGNHRVTAAGTDYDTHHIVLDFGSMPFPVLEGQSIGVVPPGTDARGKPHHARQYSISSPRNGERQGYNNLSLTVKRVLEDHAGQPVRGVASNFLCDARVGDTVEVVGPFGSSFLMPNHPRSSLIMICTGTGSAPMRAMTEWRRRLRASGRFESGRLLLFFGARTEAELPYFGPLQKLPRDFIETHFAWSRKPDAPRQYVQDLMREQAADLAQLLQDPDAYFYVCGLRSMEEGVLHALSTIAREAGLDWSEVATSLRTQGRLHLETY